MTNTAGTLVKFTAPAKEFSGALRTCLTAATPEARYAGVPILSHVLVTARPGRVTVAGSNLEANIEVGLDAGVETPGEIVLPAARVAATLAGVNGNITIAAEQKAAVFRAGRSRFKFATLPAEDFPPLFAVRDNGRRFHLEKADVAGMSAVNSAAGKEETRYYLNGVYLHAIDDYLAMVATNGLTLIRKTSAIPFDGNAIVPNKAVGMIVRLFGDGADIALDDKIIEAASGDVRYASKILDATFPNYERIMPAPAEPVIVVDKDLLATSMRQLGGVATGDSDGARTVVVSWDAAGMPGDLTLALDRSARGEGEIVIAATTRGSGRVGIGIDITTKLLDALGDGKLYLAQANASEPIRITLPACPETTAVLMQRIVSRTAMEAAA